MNRELKKKKKKKKKGRICEKNNNSMESYGIVIKLVFLVFLESDWFM